MSLSLGVDTGGTYTDAVLIRDEEDVIASAKALTTRHDLAEGIGAAVSAVLTQADVDPAEVTLASLSTTLATNALVEGQGERVGLILIGFREADLEKHGLAEALAGDPVVVLEGGHDHAGGEKAPLDEVRLSDWLADHGAEVSGFAVAAQFATRNPAHEQRATALVTELTGRPVSASHHLSAKLNGPKRALTAVLNARLIGMIDRLISRAETRLGELGVTAPLMVVRGDGALISAQFARERPIETILSGPAASIVGARWLTKADDALVSDIGGTTTDVAVLRSGRPAIDPDGAQVGPFRTMVEAVAMRTFGLGGDSEVHFVAEGLQGGVTLGPKRLVPVSLVALDDPEGVHAALDAQLLRAVPGEHDGRFVRLVQGAAPVGLSDRETGVFQRIEGVMPLGDVLRSRIEIKALRRLVERGLVQVSGVTPSDASHVLDRVSVWDRGAAEKALRLFGRRRTGAGVMLATEAAGLAQMIIDQLTHQTGLALLETAFAEEDMGFDLPPDQLARHILMLRGLNGGHRGLIRLETGLASAVIGLGASAASYYPAVAERMGCVMKLPEHGGVANAIGAVVGRVTIRRSGTVTSPSEGKFRVHLDDGPEDFLDEKQALIRLETHLEAVARVDAEAAGAQGIRVRTERDIKRAKAEAREVFIEATITVEASGRPRVAEG